MFELVYQAEYILSEKPFKPKINNNVFVLAVISSYNTNLKTAL